MPRGIKAIINPALLQWARKSAGYNLADIAKLVDQTEECVGSWESGEDHPTIAQMRKIANKLKRPLAVFYLPRVPEDFDTLRDLRRFPDGKSIAYSPKLRLLIRNIQSQQQWAAEFRKDHDAARCRFIGRANLTTDITSLAKKTRSLLNATLEEQASWKNYDSALRNWIDKCEEAGVFVFQSSEVLLEEMRGCSFPDEYAPAILLNSKDTTSARIFTLFHEFAHLLLNENGVSNLNFVEHAHTSEQLIEVFCNGLAAEILVPRQELSTLWKNLDTPKDADANILRFSKRFFVSREVIARRLRDIGFITNGYYEKKRVQYQREYLELKDKDKKNKGWAPLYRIIVKNNGREFSRTVLIAYADGDIYGRDVSELLGTKLKHLDDIKHAVFAGFQGDSLQ